MTYIKDVHKYDDDPETEAVAKEAMAEGRRKVITDAIADIVADEFDRLEDYAADHLSQVAADRAERFLESVLLGDEDAAMRLVGDYTGGDRRSTYGADADKPWASLIHGRLFETGGIRLRRKIVEAHPKLITSERIKDLESIVEGLSQQVRGLEAELDQAHQRLRGEMT
jgi:hypothetical protein